MPDLVLSDLRGGMNTQDPKHALPDDQCVLAENVEFFTSTLGERRRGMTAIDLTDSGIVNEEAVVHLGTYMAELAPVQNARLVAVAATEDTSYVFAEREAGVWTPLSVQDDPTLTSPVVYQMRSQGIHSKWFVAYDSAVDRTHVYDGSAVRRVGLSASTDAPAVVDEGSGVYSGVRDFRARWVTIVASVQTVLSEPSAETTFTPSGTGAGARITQPTPPGDGETDWIVEASDGDGNWYQIATLPVATTTYDDTTQPATDYAVNGTLSPEIGEYDYPPSVRLIKSDEDRLLYMGSWEDPEKGSRVYWTPVYAAPGIGNDERVPSNIDSYVDLDWQDGGGITDASDPVLGSFYVFKSHRIYKAQRTGNVNSAYSFYLLDPSHGAVPGSVVSGVDEYGRGAVYFIDPAVGPMRISSAGVQQLQDILGTWRRVNTNATTIACHGCFYPDKKQVRWWVAADGSEAPELMLVSQTDQIQSQNIGGTTRGWSIFTGPQAFAYCSLTMPVLVTDQDTSAVQLSFRPFMGFGSPASIQIGDLDNTDDGAAYYAHLISKPYLLAGLLNKWGGMNAGLLAAPNISSNVTLTIRLIRDFGLETQEVETDFLPTAGETEVMKIFDQLKMSDARAIAIEFVEVP